MEPLELKANFWYIYTPQKEQISILKLGFNPQGSHVCFWHPSTSCNNDDLYSVLIKEYAVDYISESPISAISTWFTLLSQPKYSGQNLVWKWCHFSKSESVSNSASFKPKYIKLVQSPSDFQIWAKWRHFVNFFTNVGVSSCSHDIFNIFIFLMPQMMFYGVS